jgi:hypothetical protein
MVCAHVLFKDSAGAVNAREPSELQGVCCARALSTCPGSVVTLGAICCAARVRSWHIATGVIRQLSGNRGGVNSSVRRYGRSRRRCQARAVRGWTVCRFHGARGGAPKGGANGAWRHGRYTMKQRPSDESAQRWSRQHARRLQSYRCMVIDSACHLRAARNKGTLNNTPTHKAFD